MDRKQAESLIDGLRGDPGAEYAQTIELDAADTVRVLVISQVALSAALPFALVLLTVLISRRQLMD